MEKIISATTAASESSDPSQL
jgi:hypothetical protein